ncbi:hypothetical protein G7Z17_g7088 [Cylindrodendrum hubeiense]|uniref:GBD/FH3 domain-containing protein n=1 Tax=Cylindrodendrum hubeiense TaxID=595255 RepID=A0A9P5LFN4_9HYPO|nr:hypothetical protein G7Z17_g7088 [Cylindrodendrum hubeiense]
MDIHHLSIFSQIGVLGGQGYKGKGGGFGTIGCTTTSWYDAQSNVTKSTPVSISIPLPTQYGPVHGCQPANAMLVSPKINPLDGLNSSSCCYVAALNSNTDSAKDSSHRLDPGPSVASRPPARTLPHLAQLSSALRKPPLPLPHLRAPVGVPDSLCFCETNFAPSSHAPTLDPGFKFKPLAESTRAPPRIQSNSPLPQLLSPRRDPEYDSAQDHYCGHHRTDIAMSADKSRQSSGGRSIFSRSKHKEKRSAEEAPKYPPDDAASYRSSRHHRESSNVSIERSGSPDGGINMMAGVITSIPYDSVHNGSRSPIPVEYLPKGEQVPVRRDPLPHHLNKGMDYHQYPSFDTPTTPTGSQSPGRSPAPNNVTMASTGRQAQYQQWGPGSGRGSTTPSTNGGRYDSYMTPNGRGSADNLSVYSNQGQSDPRLSRASNLAPPGASPSSTYANQQSHRLTKFPGPGQGGHDGFYFPKPDDDNVVEQMFLQLMQKRGWHNLPEQARRQMMAYPSQKKWTLLYQDRLTEWQGEQKRRQSVRPNQYAAPDITTYSDEEGTPEWYVRRVMEDRLDTKGMGSLEVNLRTQQIGWVKRFVECQGQVALMTLLLKINRKTAQGPAQPDNNRSDKNLDREYDIIKCVKALMNNKFGADDALVHQKVMVALATSLISPRLTTRKLVSEILTFLCTWGDNGEGHLKVIQAMDEVKSQAGENGRFDSWMRLVEVTVDGRGKMGSLVGASEELRTGGIGMENLLMEYAVATLFLINMMVDSPEKDLQLRIHIRAQFTACGIRRVLHKMEGFQYDLLDKQIERFRTNEAIDYEDMLERDNSSIKDNVEGDVKDLNDPVQIADAIQQRLVGTKTQDYFVSALQHLMLIRSNDGEERLRMFQLVDSMLSYVAMDRRLPNMDLKQSLNFTVQSLLDKLHTDSEARQAQDESLESRQIAEAAMVERDEMRARLELGADGLVAKMQRQMDEQTRFIEAQRRQADGLKAELEGIQTVRAKEAQRNELETRELYLMLRDAQDIAASKAVKSNAKAAPNEAAPAQMPGILDRDRLMERLQMQIERQKTQFKLEGRVWGDAVGPSDRLRALREEMEGDIPTTPPGGGTPPHDFTNSVLGSINRQTKIPRKPIRRREDGEMIEEGDETEGEDGVIYEKPRIIEMKRPVMDPRQQAGGWTTTAAASAAARKACPVPTADFERDCAAAWVKYFKQWRVADISKRKRLDELRAQGAQEMTVTSTFAPEGGVAEKGKGKEEIQDLLDRKQRR